MSKKKNSTKVDNAAVLRIRRQEQKCNEKHAEWLAEVNLLKNLRAKHLPATIPTILNEMKSIAEDANYWRSNLNITPDKLLHWHSEIKKALGL